MECVCFKDPCVCATAPKGSVALSGHITIRLVRSGAAKIGRIAIFDLPEDGAKKCDKCGHAAAVIMNGTALCAAHTIQAIDTIAVRR